MELHVEGTFSQPQDDHDPAQVESSGVNQLGTSISNQEAGANDQIESTLLKFKTRLTAVNYVPASFIPSLDYMDFCIALRYTRSRLCDAQVTPSCAYSGSMLQQAPSNPNHH